SSCAPATVTSPSGTPSGSVWRANSPRTTTLARVRRPRRNPKRQLVSGRPSTRPTASEPGNASRRRGSSRRRQRAWSQASAATGQRALGQYRAHNDTGAGADHEADAEPSAGERSAENTADRERSGERKPKWWFTPAAAARVVAGVVGVVALLGGEDNPPEVPTKNAASDTGGEDPMAGPAYPGDKSRFIADVSVPDGTEVKPGSTFDKIWEIQNAG